MVVITNVVLQLGVQLGSEKIHLTDPKNARISTVNESEQRKACNIGIAFQPGRRRARIQASRAASFFFGTNESNFHCKGKKYNQPMTVFSPGESREKAPQE
jgi:hypothetical protein